MWFLKIRLAVHFLIVTFPWRCYNSMLLTRLLQIAHPSILEWCRQARSKLAVPNWRELSALTVTKWDFRAAALHAGPHWAALRVNIHGIHTETEQACPLSHQGGHFIFQDQDIITPVFQKMLSPFAVPRAPFSHYKLKLKRKIDRLHPFQKKNPIYLRTDTNSLKLFSL